MNLRADTIRECLDGIIPAYVATCAPDGTPNITAISQAQYVDAEHLALSYQFFNKTRLNILANPYLKLHVIHPLTAAQYRFSLQYLRTETEGPVFESMKAKLSGIASHTGMSGVFRLLGADINRILDIEKVPGPTLQPQARRNIVSSLRTTISNLDSICDLDALLTRALESLESEFEIRHGMILMLDAPGAKLYTVASRGYETSGVGSEIPLGQGVIGVCARVETPIRIGRMTSEQAYGKAIRESAIQGGMGALLETEIPLPGIPESSSQLAVPIRAHGRLLGVLYIESPRDLQFSYDDEDALVVLAAQLGLAILDLQALPDQTQEEAPVDLVRDQTTGPAVPCAKEDGEPLLVRYYPENDSIFLGQDYLIKGVAGNIFWTLVKDYSEKGQSLFSNRELRLDPRIKLPDLSDNLEARLILLGRRLVEKNACVRMERTGRGRFRLLVERSLNLMEI